MIVVTIPNVRARIAGTKMKLSEAMRKGLEIRPVQTKGWIWYGSDAACAVGTIAAGLGYDGLMMDEWFNKLVAVYPQLTTRLINCKTHNETLWVTIVEMNDKRGKTREEIADWLESIGE